MSYLSDEIREQPAVVANLLSAQAARAKEFAAAIRDRQISYVLMAARGTSDNAARYAQYIFGSINRLPVSLATPSLFSIYQRPPQLEDALVIGVSQSGQSPDIVSVIEEGKHQGALTLAVTNEPASPLAAAGDHVLSLGAGPERAVAATKTYSAELAAMALLSVSLAGDDELLRQLQGTPEAMERTLELEGTIEAIAQRYTYATEAVVLGRGYNYATAFEIALKMKELTYMVVEPYSSADFRHGPVAIVERGFPAILIAPSGAVYHDMIELANELAERKAELLVISDREEALRLGKTRLPLSAPLPEWLSPFTCIIPGQLLAMQITLAKGNDPDSPRGLSKVTETH